MSKLPWDQTRDYPETAWRGTARLLRFARNDKQRGCHCEERSDEAILGGCHAFGSQ